MANISNQSYYCSIYGKQKKNTHIKILAEMYVMHFYVLRTFLYILKNLKKIYKHPVKLLHKKRINMQM